MNKVAPCSIPLEWAQVLLLLPKMLKILDLILGVSALKTKGPDLPKERDHLCSDHSGHEFALSPTRGIVYWLGILWPCIGIKDWILGCKVTPYALSPSPGE